MKKVFGWSKSLALASMVAAVAVGCSGEGTGSGGGVIPGGGTSSRLAPSISLNRTVGTISMVYLSGQDRRSRAIGSQIADINTIQLQNGPTDFIPTTEFISVSPLSVLLDGYTINQRDIPVKLNGVAKEFTEYPLTIDAIREVVDNDGTTVDRTAGGFAYEAPEPFDIRVKAYPGRFSTVQVRIDDLTCQWIPGQNVVFDEDRFAGQNYDPITKSIKGFISDYLAFDISAVPSGDRPTIDATGSAADRIFFSGDGIAISEGIGGSSIFELLDPVVIKSGTITEGPTINGKKALNSYKLEDTDPGLNLKTALVGVWRNYTEIVSPAETVSMISLPSSDEGNRETLVLFRQNSAGKISGMWHGYVDYDETDTTKGIFRLFPISTLTTAESTVEANGTVTNVIRSGGVVVRADWDLTGATPSGFNFPTKGAFAVVR